MKTVIRGARKTLVPAMDSDTPCPHRYSEDEGLVLEVDCRECQGAYDLSNDRCMTGIITILSAGPVPESVVLKRFIHRRYRGDAISTLAAMAAELSALNRASASMTPPSDRRCRTCAVSTSRIVADLRSALIDRPASYMTEQITISSDARASSKEHACDRAIRCAEKGLAFSTMVR